MDRRRRIIIAAVAGVLGASSLAGCSTVAPAPFRSVTPTPKPVVAKPPVVQGAVGHQLGISAGSSILWETESVRQRKLQAVADSGAAWFEMDINWTTVQAGGPHSFSWEVTDNVVKDARAQGLKVLGTIAYSPAWARPAGCPPGSDKCLPTDPDDYASFARAAAQRYGSTSTIPARRDGIQAWQIWNEPNIHQFVQPTIDVGAYTTMLKLAYTQIKAVDPAATVLAAGTSPAGDDRSGENMSPMSFLNGIYANGGQGFFDAFAHHPYSFPCNPLFEAGWNAFTQTRSLHLTMVQHGDGAKKIWGTEVGAPTGADLGTCTADSPGSSVTEAMQAQWVTDYFKGWYTDYASFTGPLFWFQIRDNGTDPYYYDDHFGLLRRDFSPKPAYTTLQRLAQG